MTKKPNKSRIAYVAKDHSLAASQPELVKGIVATLSGVKASLIKKHEFACEIVSELPYIIDDAHDQYKFPLQRDDLLKAANIAKNALSIFNKLLVTSRAEINGNLSSAHAMNPRISEDLCIKDVIAYFEKIEKALRLVKSRKRTQRTNEQSIIGQAVSKFLHRKFDEFFRIKNPQSGKGRRPFNKEHIAREVIEDLDRLCMLINAEYGISISLDARTLAWENRKKRKNKSPE